MEALFKMYDNDPAKVTSQGKQERRVKEGEYLLKSREILL